MTNGNDAGITDAAALLLRAARLKGRLTVEAAEPFAPGTADGLLEELAAAGLVQPAGTGVRLTPAGRDRLDQWLAAERATVDQAALADCYEAFDGPNRRLKQAVTRWQQRPDGRPNLHDDPGYDRGVVDEIGLVHADAGPLLDRLGSLVPRLGHYPVRLGRALERLDAGDTAYVANPLLDSYHQVWFELHEDLIGLTGRRREDEAEAGRAT